MKFLQKSDVGRFRAGIPVPCKDENLSLISGFVRTITPHDLLISLIILLGGDHNETIKGVPHQEIPEISN
jgi:hypothetical protein